VLSAFLKRKPYSLEIVVVALNDSELHWLMLCRRILGFHPCFDD
jgi:hypothetical protein